MPTLINYDLANMTNRSGNQLINLIQFTSEQTNYTAGLVISITLFLIIFMALKMKGATTASAFSATSFAMFLICVLMYPVGIISGYILLISVILMPVSIFLLYMSHNY